jgi:FkbM family methyltransferase
MAAGQGAGAGWNIEAEVAAALRLVPNENAFVIDAGANTGVWSGLFLQKHRSAHILAVEPLPVAAEQIRARKLAGLDVIQAALSSNCGKSALFLEHPLDVAASLTKRRDSLFVNRRYSQIEVETLTLDSLIPPGQAVHFLKMDLEGQELEVIQGAAQCFENQMIHTLQFEFGSANINSRSCFLDFWNALTPNGYAIFRIMPGGGLWPIPAYTEDLEYYRGATNYIATIRARQ